jgi:hypothetical protein
VAVHSRGENARAAPKQAAYLAASLRHSSRKAAKGCCAHLSQTVRGHLSDLHHTSNKIGESFKYRLRRSEWSLRHLSRRPSREAAIVE